MKRIIAAIAIFIAIGIPSGFVLANSFTSQPQTPTVCTVNGTLVGCTTSTPNPTDVATYTKVLKDLGFGQDECFADGSFDIGVSCDTDLVPPPVGGHCNGVNGGGILSPTIADATLVSGFGNQDQRLFRSLDCYAIWGALNDVTGTHDVTSVTLTDTSTTPNRVQMAFLAPRITHQGDWTSTYMMSYIPGDHYTLNVQSDGTNQTISYP